VSESNDCHCAGSVQSHWVGICYVKQMCLETGPEDSHRRCGSDVFRQTVPDNEYLTWIEYLIPCKHSLKILYLSKHSRGRYGGKREWVFVFLKTVGDFTF